MESATRPSMQLKSLMNEMDMELKTVDRYFKIHRTIVEMLDVRGYQISKDETSSTHNLHAFMKYMKWKKSQEREDIIFSIVQDLIDNKYLTEDRNSERFREKISDLVEHMNPDDISEQISTYFKTTSKLTRNLGDVFEDKLKSYDLEKTVEYLNQIYIKKDNEKIFCYYFFNTDTEKKENKKRVNDVIREILDIQKKDPDVKDILFISENKMNTQMVDDLKKYTEKMRITIFLGDHLLFNITKHFLVPKHHLMSPEETKDFLKDKEKGLVKKLPKIYETDPISRFYGAKAGQIFKITRENLSDDSMIRFTEFYRYVVQEIKK